MENQTELNIEAVETIEVVELDGKLVNADTGEIIGLVKKTFEVKTPKEADWVLEQISGYQSEILATQTQLQEVCSRLEKKIKTSQKNIEWFIARYGPGIDNVARDEVSKLKRGTKTASLVYGDLSVSDYKGGELKCTDKIMAATTYESEYPDSIKITKEFLISTLTKEQKEKIKVDLENMPGLPFEVSKPKSVVTIKVLGKKFKLDD